MRASTKVGTGEWANCLECLSNLDSHNSKVDAYKLLFKTDRITALITSTDVKVACLVRSQLIHDSGIATEKFVKKAKALGVAPWNAVAQGDRLPLDGVNVATLSEAVVHRANDLILALDEWLGRRDTRVAKPQDQAP